ncbi:unnamed protein product [Rhizophagus irregularis]|uniref:Uncharacterized protein n=1 Tax=Rhizophagus irregularis TaxID=588596 RepID=A0A916E3M4_9GLOM|nr:unnamed protein product [Rhizophagus irregularis]CAB5356608.1 unnamed protein product [Rhizophagus irregularis]
MPLFSTHTKSYWRSMGVNQLFSRWQTFVYKNKENSSIVEKINSDFTDQQSNGRIEIYLAFIQENAQQFVAVSPVFQKTCDAAYKKHVLQHPARSLFELFKFFDSRFLSLTTANRDIYFYQIIRELVNSSISLIQEWSIYININLNLIEFTE